MALTYNKDPIFENAIGKLFEYSSYDKSTYVEGLDTQKVLPARHPYGYVEVNYVSIGGKDILIEHNRYLPSHIELGGWVYINRKWVLKQWGANSIKFDCQQVCSDFGTRDFISTRTELPVTGVEVFFTRHPQSDRESQYAYSGVMEIGRICHDFGWGMYDPQPTSCEFIGIADMDLPSVLLLDNFDTYIPKIRYGVYAKYNKFKIIINGAVAYTGNVCNSSGDDYLVLEIMNHRGVTLVNNYYIQATKQDYEAMLRGNHKLSLWGWFTSEEDVFVKLDTTVEINTYNCKYVNLRQGSRLGDSNREVALAGLVTTNLDNQFPHLMVI